MRIRTEVQRGRLEVIAFEDGVTIVHLVESVSMKKVGRWAKNPKMYAQKLENTTAALKILEQDGIQLVNIGECTYKSLKHQCTLL